MATLIQLTHDMQRLDDLLAETGGNIDHPDILALLDAYESAAIAFDEKVDGYTAIIREYQARQIAVRAELDQLQAKMQTLTNAESRLKQRLMGCMVTAGKTKAGVVRTATICQNGGKAPVDIDIADARELPPRFQKVRVDHDIDAIRAALEASETLPFARLGERGRHIRIK